MWVQVIHFELKISKNKGVRGTLVLSKKPAAAAPTPLKVPPLVARAQVMVPQLPFNATTPLPPRVSGSENEEPQIRGVFLNYDQIHTKK